MTQTLNSMGISSIVTGAGNDDELEKKLAEIAEFEKELTDFDLEISEFEEELVELLLQLGELGEFIIVEIASNNLMLYNNMWYNSLCDSLKHNSYFYSK